MQPLFSNYPLEDYKIHQEEIDAALHRALARGHYILGEEVTAFEQEFAAFVGTKHAIGVANGTDSIEVILRALDLGKNARVAVPSHTAVASISAIARAGATPVFVDVEADTFTMCADSLEQTMLSTAGDGLKAMISSGSGPRPRKEMISRRRPDASDHFCRRPRSRISARCSRSDSNWRASFSGISIVICMVDRLSDGRDRVNPPREGSRTNI